ncbi:MAG: chromate efflux transporter [Sulfuricaulis sp.]|uniref:chromate efflux transporter n=1 Tax=Sulfuricaulis sp. TaxID=2003553 RepID=UPI0025F6CF0B|nr:chromate efflux transporter [Sulfuricaulis sp.]MCR4346053.1 chromate efflux transporter [Sulfuricaulis sp.]
MKATHRHSDSVSPELSLSSIFWLFFRIACTSFGGFMAMISVVENVVVERKKLLSHQTMLDGISLASMLPGPVAVNVCTYVGYRLRGRAGALVAATAAILPAFVLVVVLSAAYFRWGQIPVVSKLFMGFIPAVAAVIVAAAWNMSRKSLIGLREEAIAIVAFVALLGIGGFYSTLGIIIGGGIIGWLLFRTDRESPSQPDKKRNTSGGTQFNANALLLSSMPMVQIPWWSVDPAILMKLFSVFAGMSLMLFGGGYVFIPLIQEIVVTKQQWVTTQEFIDGIALGQITPGPILVSAAFIGLKVAGLAGAVVATVAIFAPPALLMVAASGVFDRLQRSSAIQAALRGVRPAVIGMIFAAAVVVGRTAAPVWYSIAIFAIALYALIRFRVEAVWVIPAAGLAGWWLY